MTVAHRPPVPLRDPTVVGSTWYDPAIVRSPTTCGDSVGIFHLDSPWHDIPKARFNNAVSGSPLNYLRSYSRGLHLVTYLTARHPDGTFLPHPLRFVYWNSLQDFEFSPNYNAPYGMWAFTGGVHVNIGSKGTGLAADAPYYPTPGPTMNASFNQSANWTIQARPGRSPGQTGAALHRSGDLSPETDDVLGGSILSFGLRQALSGRGHALDGETRRVMEPVFGHDLGKVLIHTDSAAAESARSLKAAAYTIGQHVVFGAGKFSPRTAVGRGLLAHELAHTVQQGEIAPSAWPARLPIASPSSPEETAARRLGLNVESSVDARSVDVPVIARADSAHEPSPLPGVESSRGQPDGRSPWRRVALADEDAKQSRMIGTGSAEFLENYVDNNIVEADFWSTAFARQDRRLNEFTVHYRDGRSLTFSIEQVGLRTELNRDPGLRARGYVQARIGLNPTRYVKRGGFIFPDIYSEASVPRLRDIASTIEFNHRQREKFLEIATVTFKFAVILASYATPPELPVAGGSTMPRRAVRVMPQPKTGATGPVVRESSGAAVLPSGAVSARAQTARSLRTSIRADLGEAEAYREMLRRGEIGLQRPGGANVRGVDCITAARRASGRWEVIVTDVKTSEVGRFPTRPLVLKPAWLQEVRDAVSPGRLGLGDRAVEQALRDAVSNGRVRTRQVNVDYSAAGQGAISGF